MEFKKDLASIIMPSCHKLTSINKICFENSIKQNYENVEFLIFVNGINRTEYNNLMRFLETKNIYNHKIKSLYSKSRVAIGKARRDLLKISNGEYIIFLDSDDIPCKNLISNKVEISKKYDSNIVFCNAKLNKIKSSRNSSFHRNYYIYLSRFKNFFNNQLFEGINLFPNSGTLIKKNSKNMVLLYHYPFCKHEDFIFYKRLISINKEFTITNQYLISYNVGNSFTSNKLRSRIWHFKSLTEELNRPAINAFFIIINGFIIIIFIRFLFAISKVRNNSISRTKKISLK